MNENLQRLIRLQDLMSSLADLTEKQAAIPAEVGRLEKDLLAVETEVKREKEALGELQKERRRLESELMGVESKIQKYQGQLAEVKTNKEYQAMQHEIENCRNERAALDERILLDMEQQEKAVTAGKVLDQRLAGKKRETDQGKGALQERLAALKAAQAKLEAEREAVQKAVPPAMLDPFLKIARTRRGTGLVAVRDELCAGCHVRVMPKLIQEIRRSTGLIACNSCGRFLYIPDDAAAAAASAAAAAGTPQSGDAPAT